MKNMNSKIPSIAFHFALAIVYLLISACAKNDDNNKSSYIQFTNPASAFKQKTMSRAVDLETIDSIKITITNTNGNQISSVDVFNAESTVKLKVPGNIPLIVSASAFGGESLLYFGEVTVNSVRPGSVSTLSLLLYDQNQTNDPISVEFPLGEPTVVGKSEGMSFSRD